MTDSRIDPLAGEGFGHDVLGPIMAEFCLRLWSVTSQMERPDGVALLFCARGGLRMQCAFERFTAASGLVSQASVSPLMVSRLVALRSSLWRSVREGGGAIGPAAANAISYEFRRSTVGQLAQALTGAAPAGGRYWDRPADPAAAAELLGAPEGRPVVAAVAEQSALFETHLASAVAGRDHAVLVDTGLYGTTRELLAEGVPGTDFSSALIARTFRPGGGPGERRSVGLSVSAPNYSPLRARTVLLRYWHFVEWFLEPALPSVRSFTDVDGVPRSNLEIDGWRSRVLPADGEPFAGVLRYLDALPRNPGAVIAADAERAWPALRRAVVWPTADTGDTLSVGPRSHDFGSTATWGQRGWRGPLSALRGASMWREGEIARSGTPLRLPLLAVVEAAYGARSLHRGVSARLRALR